MIQNKDFLNETTQFDRRQVLKFLVAATIPADVASSYTLGSPITRYMRKGGVKGTFVGSIPGFMAPDVREQTKPLFSVWDQYGDSMMIQADGGIYDELRMAEDTAEHISDLLRTRKYGRLVMNGVSMGGNVSADALTQLDSNRTFEDYSAEPYAIMFDTPASGNDLPGRFQAASPIAEYRAGRIANLLPRINGVDESFLFSQAEALTDRTPLDPGSLNFLNTLVYWRSLKGNNMVQANRAIANGVNS